MTARRQLWRRTLRALAAPRRLAPVAVVTAVLSGTELLYTRSPSALALDLSLCLIFWLLGPASWRRLCAGGGGGGRRARGYAAYLLLGLLVVGVVGGLGPRLLGLAFTFATDLGSLGVLYVLFVVGGWGLGRDIELEEGLEEERRRAARLAHEAEQAQLLALRANLDPHFLFNTLNAIAEWCREDPEVAEAALLRLAGMLRSILAGVRAPAWPLSRELELVSDLFELYRVRDPDRYDCQCAAPDSIPPGVTVPPMLLLPLAENAVKHGPSAGHRGPVRLAVETRGDRLVVEVRNGGPCGGPRAGGEGLALVERRLALAYAGQARLELRAEGEATVAVVEVPRSPLGPEELPP